MPRTIGYEDPNIPYEASWVPYESPVPEQPQALECWVTTPDGTYIAHLDRSEESPFREFAVSLIRNEPGAGSLEYHPDNQTLTDYPTLFDLGNLVWMKYRGTTRAWIIEDDRATVGEDDWRRVSGRGTLQLLGDRLVYPTGFASGTNLDPATWTSQWYSVVNRAAGEMLWDMVSASNARFTTQITRSVAYSTTTGSDGWTQDFRFENILEDVVKPVTDVHGDVEMSGLALSYYTTQGTNKTASVIFEEGADLLSLTRDRSDRDALSYVIGEGVGEGVFAKLAIASRADARRKEGFLAAKEATNLGLLQSLTTAALNENVRRETVSFEIDESRFRVFTDFGLGDAVRAIALDGTEFDERIDAIYLAEDGDRVRVALDLNGLREDELLRLYGEQRRTRQSIGVRNRQPQGNFVPYSIGSTPGILDSATPMHVFFSIPTEMYVTKRAEFTVNFRQFTAPVTAAISGGGSSPTTASGGSSTPTTSSGGGSTPTTGASSGIELECPYHAGHYHVTSSHGHGVTIPAHDHSVTISGHQHSVTVAPHTHSLDFTLTAEPFPVTHNVSMGVYKRVGAAWVLQLTVSGMTDEIEDVDLSATVNGPGQWRLTLQNAVGQPQGGRLSADVYGHVTGAIQSA